MTRRWFYEIEDSLLFLVIFVILATSVAFYVSSAEIADENLDFTKPYSIVLADGEGVEPNGKPIDTLGMPTEAIIVRKLKSTINRLDQGERALMKQRH